MVLDRYSHEKDKHSMLRVACVYLREVTNMIFTSSIFALKCESFERFLFLWTLRAIV